MEQSYIQRTSGIKARDKIGYAMGDLASCLVFGLTQSILNKYYTDVLDFPGHIAPLLCRTNQVGPWYSKCGTSSTCPT